MQRWTIQDQRNWRFHFSEPFESNDIHFYRLVLCPFLMWRNYWYISTIINLYSSQHTCKCGGLSQRQSSLDCTRIMKFKFNIWPLRRSSYDSPEAKGRVVLHSRLQQFFVFSSKINLLVSVFAHWALFMSLRLGAIGPVITTSARIGSPGLGRFPQWLYSPCERHTYQPGYGYGGLHSEFCG
jgi:hypothetical protein